MATASLNGIAATGLRLTIPAYGLWWAEVECASQDALASGAAVTLAVDDLTLRGTIVSGGAYQLRTRYRVVAGAGGWGRSVGARSYANDLGVKAAIVLRDAAAEVGEALGAVPPTTFGPAFVRASGPASRVLDAVSPRAWYVDNAGVTQFGRRPAVAYTAPYQQQVNDAAQGRIDIAPSEGSVSALVPGAIVDGIGEAVDVEHTIDGGALRTSVWGAGISDTSRLSEALRRIVETFTASHRFFAPWEYRVVARNLDRVDLQIVRVASGMPDLRNVPSCASEYAALLPDPSPTLGSTCVVSFLNGDPSRPQIMARAGDAVLIGPSAYAAATVASGGGPVTAASSLVGHIGVGG